MSPLDPDRWSNESIVIGPDGLPIWPVGVDDGTKIVKIAIHPYWL